MNSILKYALISPVLIIVLGTLGYSVIEQWDFLKSLSMTIITITAVGFSEQEELLPVGKIFTIFLSIGGVGLGAYTIGNIARIMVEGELRKLLVRRKLEREIRNLKHHYLVSGFGRIGSAVSREFTAEHLPFMKQLGLIIVAIKTA